MKRIAVFASGGGSNSDALAAYLGALGKNAPAEVVVVVSHRSTAGALERAKKRGIATATIANPANAEAILALLAEYRVDLIVLAGYLKHVPAVVTEAYAGRIVNIHPALLPRHGGSGMYGPRVHVAVLEAGDKESGATVHFVDAQYDRGATIVQARVPVDPGDTPELLAARVLRAEHFVLPRAVHALANGSVRLGADGETVIATSAVSLFAGPPAGMTVALGG